MTNLRKMFFLALLLLAGMSLQAQPGGGGRDMNPEQRAERQTTQMKQDLALSDAQAAKVQEINLKYANKAKEAREKADGNWEGMRETMTAMRQEQDKELQTVLTQEQWQQWSKLVEERRANRGDMGRGNRPGTEKAPPPSDDKGKKSKKDKNKNKNKNKTDDSNQ